MSDRTKWILATAVFVGGLFVAFARLADRAEQADVREPASEEAVTTQPTEPVADVLAQDAEVKDRVASIKLTHEETHALHLELIEEVKAARAQLLALAPRATRTQKSLAEARASALQDEEITALHEDVQELRAQLMAKLNGSPEVAALLKKRDGMESELTDATASHDALRLKMQREGINDVSRQAMLDTSSRTTALQRDLSRLNKEIEAAQMRIREADDGTSQQHVSIVEAEHHLAARIKDQPEVLALEAERE